MSYGVLLKKNANNFVVNENSIIFYPTQRAGVSTSDTYYFSTLNFTTNKMYIYFSQYGNIISSSAASTFSRINFDLNTNNFYGSALNISKPTWVKICNIESYETGIAQSVFSSGFENGTKYIQNLSQPGYILEKTTDYPLGVQSSYFSKAMNFLRKSVTYGGFSYDFQNFAYVTYTNAEVTKNFLAVPTAINTTIPNNFTWYELPTNQFNYLLDFYITKISSGFDGTSLPISTFKNIILNTGQTILVNNASFNDLLSGVYTIQKITDKVYLTKSNIVYNFPGQIFSIKTDLDLSTNLLNNSSCYYVPYDYGCPAETFSKPLMLTKYVNIAETATSAYVPLYKDGLDTSMIELNLVEKGKLAKQSDSFILGIAVSSWFPDSTLFGVGLNYEIKEGF